MDRFGSIILFAGLGCFALAFLLSGLYPYLITDAEVPAATIVELAQDVPAEFRDLKDRYPVSFGAAYPGSDAALTTVDLLDVAEDDPARDVSEAAWRGAYATALRNGRDTYIAEGCWHCHSQYVRVVSNEFQRFGPPSTAQEYQNALNQPHLWGTRRVGPDLARTKGRHPNDWHIAHLIQPKNVFPNSVMPSYDFWFEEDGAPKRDGFAVVTYLQWIGTTYTEGDTP